MFLLKKCVFLQKINNKFNQKKELVLFPPQPKGWGFHKTVYMNIEEYKTFVVSLSKEDLEQISYFNKQNVNYGRKLSKALLHFTTLEKYENPVTKKENICDLQEILVQTCIDYINKHNLTDIYSVSFSVDSLQTSAKYKEWTPESDSYISVCGIEEDAMGSFMQRKLIGEIY